MEELAGLGILRFKPLYMERVWGGDGLNTHLGRALPTGGPIGESWEIVDRPEAQSVVDGGVLEGCTLADALRNNREALLGPGWRPDDPFPVLVKWLDCEQRLSLQVHPPASEAPQLGGEPKTENWYVAAAKPGASLIVGLKSGVDRAQFETALRSEQLESCVHAFDVQPGDSLLVASGRLHAIDAGNLILEIQQNSDTTYRVYDWGRVGLDGNPRQLHVEESLRCIDFDDFEPTPLRAGGAEFGSLCLAHCDEFRITQHVLEAGERLTFDANSQPSLLHVVQGQLRDSQSGTHVGRGDNVLLPYAPAFDLEACGDALVLVTDQFHEKNSQLD